jgi:two-component system, OmpR family, alkaline phosphatase synthesis response regulator PhoP
MDNLRKILIVDDEEIVVAGIKKGLEYTGHNVKTILGGKEAIKLAAKEHFDLVIVDLVMPGLNGVETCRGIKEVSPSTEIVLLSGFPNEIERLLPSFLAAGGRDLFLRKPLYATEVEETIHKLFKENDAIEARRIKRNK